jgi:hypothetical protein
MHSRLGARFTMWKFTEWQLQARPRDAAFLIIRIIHLQINYLVADVPAPTWSLDKSQAWCFKDRDHCYQVGRRNQGLMVMEVAP